ncbi:MAG: rhomboid family intramembrane serine protease [Methylococcaceae bacterium]
MPLFDYYPRKQPTIDPDTEKKIFKYSLLFPIVIVGLFWLVKVVEDIYDLDLAEYGILPLHLEGLKGIFLSPFIHGSYDHLISNSLPFLILGFALFYFYRNLAYRILFLIYLLSGLCVWLGGRESYHIGASGIVYGLASFLFFSGALRKDASLLTIGIIVIFLYGSMFWGMFPFKPDISWESHLWGALSGLILSWYYRHQGPARHKASWEDEPEEEDEEEATEEMETPEEETGKV